MRTPRLAVFARILAVVLLTGTASLPLSPGPAVAAETFLRCSFGAGPGDRIDRGFYLPGSPVPGWVESVSLTISPQLDGDYVIGLAARADTYDGPMLAEAEGAISGATPQVVTFVFDEPFVITSSTTVTFAMERLSGPDGAIFYYTGSFPTDPALPSECPFIETNGTQPPLSDFRRSGVGIEVNGEAFAYRLAIPFLARGEAPVP